MMACSISIIVQLSYVVIVFTVTMVTVDLTALLMAVLLHTLDLVMHWIEFSYAFI